MVKPSVPRVRDFGCGSLHTILTAGESSLHYFTRGTDDARCTVEHAYPSHSLVFTDDGEWSYHGTQQPHVVDAGTVVAGHRLAEYACSHPHGLSTTCFIVTLSENAFDDQPASLFEKSVVPTSSEMLLHRRAIERHDGDSERLEGLVYSLYDVVTNAAARRSRSHRFDVRMAYAMRLLRERVAEPVSVATIARELNLSRFTFTRRFLSHSGVTPHAYLAGIRIDRAKQQLASTKLSIDDIAAFNGFCSLAHFSNAFRRATGSSPTTFRKK